MKLSLVGGLAALVFPVAAQAGSRVDVSVRADVPAAHVYQAEWHHGWRRHYDPPVYYSPPVTVCPPSTYYYEEPTPYCAPDYVTPSYVPPVVVEPDYGYYGGYWGGHYRHERYRHEEHGWHGGHRR